MSATGLTVFDRTLQKTNQFINDVGTKIGIEDKHVVFVGIRAVFKSLRDRLPVEEAVQLGAQLPILLAGFYYESWKPSNTPTKERDYEAYIQNVRDNLPEGDYPIEIEILLKGVFATLSDWVTAGEIEEVAQMFPKELQSLWPTAVIS